VGSSQLGHYGEKRLCFLHLLLQYGGEEVKRDWEGGMLQAVGGGGSEKNQPSFKLLKK